jgi:phosphoribosyl 1,2-cyclic phosphodiesterase
MDHTLRFWGVRGSLPSPGPSTAGVGGNTSCVEVVLGGARFVIDGGTGLRALGAARRGAPLEATLLFSHLHWDHIQGVPFFAPLYHPASRVTFVGPAGLREALVRQMSRPTFPVTMDEAFAARVDFRVVAPGERLTIADVEIATEALAHPGGAIGYRLRCGDGGVAYLCDHEQGAAPWPERLVALAAGAEAIVADTQYLPEEYPAKVGWGHGTFVELCALADRAGADRLYLTHHDPLRSDADVRAMEARAREAFAGARAAAESGPVALRRGCGASPGAIERRRRDSAAPRSTT